MTDTLRVSDLTVRYGDVVAVDGVSFDVGGGTLAALVGPSGCGKTSILRAIAGFEMPARGTISIGGDTVVSATSFVQPERRRIGMLFQQGALFPHLDVFENVAFGLRNGERDRAIDTLRLVGLEDLRSRRPHELSGGQQQRVALARALAPRPRLLLLDEPFAALDAPLRVRLRADIREILKETGTTAVLVTHDQEEALSIAEQVSVLRAGKILQTGTPREVYEHPLSTDVANLVGDANLVEATISGGRVSTPLGTLATSAKDGPCIVRVPTESIVPSESGARGVVAASHFYGHDVVDEVRLDDGRLVRMRLPQSTGEPGTVVRIGLKPQEYRVFLPDGSVVVAR